ncbi:MAG: DUF7144 family membrane protein [Jiangellaceae bacterium]
MSDTNLDRQPWAAGATVFAGSLMIMVGIFQFIQGLVALVNDDFFGSVGDYTFEFDVTTWGWIHLIVGALVALAGFFIFTGNVAARALGIFLAVLSALANFLWIPYYPIWALLMIAIAVFVIWGLSTFRQP